MTRRARIRVVVAAAAALSLLVAAALVLVLSGRGGVPEPLDAGSVGALTQRLKGGATFADADVVMFNRADDALTLQGVQVIATGPDVPAHFRFLVAVLDRSDDVRGGADLNCPPEFFREASVKPMRGFVLQPRSTPAGSQGAVLIICFEAPAPTGRFRITGLRIAYEHDGERRTVTITRNLAVCAAPKARCEPPSESDST